MKRMMELGNTGKGRERQGTLEGRGLLQKRASLTAGLKQVVINSNLIYKYPAYLPFSYDFLESAWIKLSNESRPFSGSGIVK